MNKVIIIILTLFAMVSCKLFSDDSDPEPEGPPEGVTDLAITDLTAPEVVSAESAAEIQVTVKNEGSNAVNDSVTVILTNETEDETIGTQKIGGLSVNDTTTVTFIWNTDETSTGEHTLNASIDFQDDDSGNNEETVTVTVSEQAVNDITITEVNAPETATHGDTVDVEFTVGNIGTEDYNGTIEITVTNETDNTTLFSENIDGLAADETQDLVYSWDTGESSAGEHTIVISHNYEDDNVENNSSSFTIDLNEVQTSDVAVTNVDAPESATEGDEIDVEVTVRNQGEEDISDEITVTLTDDTDGTTIDTQTINGLEMGAESTLTFSWNTSDASTGEHTLIATHDFEDDDEANNSESVTVTLNEEMTSDLSIIVTNAPENVTRGDTADVEVEVENLGDFDITDAITVSLTHHGSVEAESQTISGGLNAGSSATLTLHWDTSEQSTGAPPHAIVLQHDFDDGIEANNADTTYIQVNMPD